MKARLIAVFAVLFCFTSCMKEDKPIVLPEQGDAYHETLNLGADYSTQFYYNLKEKEIVHTNRMDSWDLAFESSKTGYGVFLNGGNGLALVETNKTNFSDITIHDCEGEIWRQDDPAGDASKTAIGEWNLTEISKNKIYIIRLDATNSKTRTLKLSKVTDESYEFEVGELGKAETKNCIIKKDWTRVYSYFDLELLTSVPDVEPAKESWDILFTRYGFTFYEENPPLPYIVTGVLSNPRTSVFKDSVVEFNSIGSEFVTQGNFSYDKDAIGYNWKNYDFDNGLYTIRSKYSYIIRTQNLEVFKLRFWGFYNSNGIKGVPSFEFEQIQ